MFRLRRTPLAVTLMRYLSLHSIIRSVALGRMFTRVTDLHLDHRITRVLQEDAFVAIDNTWLKTNLGVAEPAGTIADRLTELAKRGGTAAPHYEKMVTLLRDDKATEDTQAMVDVERLLWPVKIIDAAIPTFMVPIRAQWAQELFDERLAAQTLFGAQLDLALNREAVYYRSSKPAVLTAPGRILWYVSQHGSYQGTGHIRACSRLDEVVVGKPKDLFRQFRRLGVYTWSNVLTVANHDTNRDIMALRFSNSELFAVPIPLATLRRVIQDTGSNVQLQGPTRLSEHAFAEFYRTGMDLSKDLPSNVSYD